MSLPSDFPCRNVIAVADLHTHVDLKKIVERTYIAEFEREPKVRVCMCDTIVAHACTYMHASASRASGTVDAYTCIYELSVCVHLCAPAAGARTRWPAERGRRRLPDRSAAGEQQGTG